MLAGSRGFYPTFLKDQVSKSATNTPSSRRSGKSVRCSAAQQSATSAASSGGALVPTYVGPRDLTLIAPVFFEQLFVGGVWGPIPIRLMELAPPALRILVVSLTYQLGNLASSASATI